MRVKLSPFNREFLFSQLQTRFKNINLLGACVGVSPRTIRDWRRGKYLMTDNHFELIARLADILFDTDGCIYLDRHIIKGKTYRNMGWTFTNYADKLRADVYETLKALGFSPTCQAPYQSVFLRRKDEVLKYFEEIGSHNNKHLTRYQNFTTI